MLRTYEVGLDNLTIEQKKLHKCTHKSRPLPSWELDTIQDVKIKCLKSKILSCNFYQVKCRCCRTLGFTTYEISHLIHQCLGDQLFQYMERLTKDKVVEYLIYVGNKGKPHACFMLNNWQRYSLQISYKNKNLSLHFEPDMQLGYHLNSSQSWS